MVVIFTNLAISNFLSFLPLYVSDVYSQGTVAIGAFFTVIFLSQALAGITMAWVSQKARQVAGRAVLLSIKMGAAALLFLLPKLGLYPFLGVHVALAFILTAVGISIMAVATEMPSRGLGMVIGLVESVGMVAGLMGPIIGGLVYEQDPLWLFPFSGVLMLGIFRA